MHASHLPALPTAAAVKAAAAAAATLCFCSSHVVNACKPCQLLLLLLRQALVYLYEVAPEQRRGLLSSLGCVCLGLGVALGAAVVAAVAAFMPAGRGNMNGECSGLFRL
jgi:hypothetical protein